MKKIENFFKSKKVDKHFKKSGPGHRLTDTDENLPPEPSAPNGRDVAAQAALKRLTANDKPKVSAGKQRIQMIAQRELEDERRKNNLKNEHQKENLEDGMKALKLDRNRENREPNVQEFEHSDVVAGIYYSCDLLGHDVRMEKQQLISAIEEFLLKRLENRADMMSAMILLHSANPFTIKHKAIEMIARYLLNIIQNPNETKFRRIRVANKAFQERVIPAKGAIHFLKAIGFHEEQQKDAEGQAVEPFYVMGAEVAENTEQLTKDREALLEDRSVTLKLSRNASIVQLKENEKLVMPKVSDDFFDLTAAEVKNEQQLRTEEVEKMSCLRTREMRERDKQRRQYKYKYALLKIRLPDRYVLQGTFGCHEPISAVHDFVGSHLPEHLQGTTSCTLKNFLGKSYDDNAVIGELGLCPAAVLHCEVGKTS